jgi:hypothetical protein
VRRLSRPPLWPEGLVALPSSLVQAYVLAKAGARPWNRDAVDKRIVQTVRAGGGRVIDSEDEVGGYRSLSEIM